MNVTDKDARYPHAVATTLSAKQLATVLGVSLRHVRRLNTEGMLPHPVQLGRAIRWIEYEITAWLEAGAPNRNLWEKLKAEKAWHATRNSSASGCSS